MQQQEWKAASSAHRARRRAAFGIGMYAQARPLGISAERAAREDRQVAAALAALPAAPAPVGFSAPLPPRRPANYGLVLSKIREARAELARRAAERAEYEALGLDVPRYITSDENLRRAASAAGHFRRDLARPLAHLADVEANLRVVRAYRDMLAAQTRAAA